MRKLVFFSIVGLVLAGCARSREGIDSGPAGTGQGAVAGSCVETYSPDNLTGRQMALDGVVTEVRTGTGSPIAEGEAPSDETLVTFDVRRWYKGGAAASIALKSDIPAGAVSSVDFPVIEKGNRYLVAGDGGFMWACGFTRDYSEAEAQIWAEAFES